MEEFRCRKCKGLLFKGILYDSRTVIEVKHKCGETTTFRPGLELPGQLEPDGTGGYVLTKAKAEA